MAEKSYKVKDSNCAPLILGVEDFDKPPTRVHPWLAVGEMVKHVKTGNVYRIYGIGIGDNEQELDFTVYLIDGDFIKCKYMPWRELTYAAKGDVEATGVSMIRASEFLSGHYVRVLKENDNG